MDKSPKIFCAGCNKEKTEAKKWLRKNARHPKYIEIESDRLFCSEECYSEYTKFLEKELTKIVNHLGLRTTEAYCIICNKFLPIGSESYNMLEKAYSPLCKECARTRGANQAYKNGVYFNEKDQRT